MYALANMGAPRPISSEPLNCYDIDSYATLYSKLADWKIEFV